MTHKISGTVEEPSRLIVLDESDFSTLEYNDTVSGTYDVTVVSGSKTVIIRSADGESFGYGAVASKDDGVPLFDGEDLTTYTLSTPNNRLSLANPYRVNFTDLASEDSDNLSLGPLETEFVGDFEVQFEAKIDTFENDFGTGFVSLSRGYKWQTGANRLYVVHAYANSSNEIRVTMRVFNASGLVIQDHHSLYGADTLIHYYYTMKRVGNGMRLNGFTDAERTQEAFEVAYSNSYVDDYSLDRINIITPLNAPSRPAAGSGFVQNVKVISK
jgi:hypothetical protein